MNDLFTNQNIFLRALEKEDLDYLYKWENSIDIWHLSNTLIPFSRFTLKQYIETSSQDIYEAKQLRLIIQHKGTGKALGTVDLFDFDPYNLRAGVGILIAEKSERKKGFAGEALDILIRYSNQILNLKQLYCNILENNEDSLKLFISRGFSITGAKKEWVRAGNQWITEFMLQRIFH